ncbi:hypothetical protein P22_1490 [Propionispora sp. 2/2-37]|nr:hypothetical protein P22_1490 [Propionispora sp. 2/2-37]
MAIIALDGSEERLSDMTRKRHMAVLPFGGEYCIIDYLLSNMVNSGICRVGILLQGPYRTVIEYLRSGKEWYLAGKQGGLFFLPPFSGSNHSVVNFYHNLDSIEQCQQEYLFITGSTIVCSVDYREVASLHLDRQADITVLYSKESRTGDNQGKEAVFDVAKDNRVRKVSCVSYNQGEQSVSMDMYFIRKSLFVDLLCSCYREGGLDLGWDCFWKYADRLRIYGWQHVGPIARINSLKSYYRHQMQLLAVDACQQLYLSGKNVYTKAQDEPPASYLTEAVVANALIANGCVVEGKVENSILFSGVCVNKGAVVKNSIIMPGCRIEENVRLENVICDQNVHVGQGRQLQGSQQKPLFVETITSI